ncbi:MAG: SusC/RagA family TonB-linked outer membrane protein, partial [Bacteroidales bacterium]|nr:SusC/RagA family TonB-linked outer membrane protein [Bacteroidales bacterium]
NDYQYRQGKSVDGIYGLEALGLFQDVTEIANSPVQKYSEAKPGDIKYKEQNDDHMIDAKDQVRIGNSQARFSYGLNLLLKYGNLSLMATGDGRSGYQYLQRGEYFWVEGNDKYSAEVLNRWTPETAATATYPRLSSQASTNNHQSSTYWLKNGNYFSLNRVQLTYDVPKSIIKNWASKDISIYVRGSNLGMWSANSYQRQLNIGAEPDYRNYVLGVNLLF